MNVKPLVIVIGIMTAVIMGTATSAEARGFGSRGGFSVRIGIGGSSNRGRLALGPGFYAAPRINRPYVSGPSGPSQYERRQWNYYRSGPIGIYRPVNPAYRTR